jgi:nucleoside-diphosphate-sugar epimerase
VRWAEKAPAAICRKLIEAKVSGKLKIEIWGSGNQTRSFMFIDDYIEGTEYIACQWAGKDLSLDLRAVCGERRGETDVHADDGAVT